MRITHEINETTRNVYNPSMETLMLTGEIQRIMKAECLVWDKSECPPLTKLCLTTILNNFHNIPLYEKLPCWERSYLIEKLSLDLELEQVIPLIENQHYWERRFEEHFSTSISLNHYGWTWKCIYLEHYVQQLCEEAEPEYSDENNFEKILNLCAPYIHVLTVEKLRFWKYPLNMLVEERPEDIPRDHISFVNILKILPNVEIFSLSYKIDHCEEFDLSYLKVSVGDCVRLSEALGNSKSLRSFRLVNSRIECDHIKALLRNWTNTSIEQLDLSYCRISDTGAKCVALFCTTNKKIKVLKLRNNRIGVEGASGIAWALISPEGTNLECLDLSLNPLGSEGVMVIFRALVRSTVLRELNLSNCQVKLYPHVYLGAMLMINHTLRVLDLSGNEIDPAEGDAVLEALNINNGLWSLNLRFTGIDLEIQAKIKTMLKYNLEQCCSKSNRENVSYLKSISDSDVIPTSSSTN